MKKLTEEEAERLVIEILRSKGPMTSWEIDDMMRDRDAECPDSSVLFLSKLRMKGRIKGEISKERRGWIWWVED